MSGEIKLYNTLTRKKELFKPLNPNNLNKITVMVKS